MEITTVQRNPHHAFRDIGDGKLFSLLTVPDIFIKISDSAGALRLSDGSVIHPLDDMEVIGRDGFLTVYE